jgi:glycosyltransferase involved in cell wall biosynthesis
MSETTKLIMLGAAPETRGSVAATVEGWRAEGVFRRWPVETIATTSARGAAGDAKVLWHAVRRFGELLGRHRRAVVHAHFCPRTGFWRQAAFAGVALAFGRPLVVQLHGGGYEAFHDGCGTPARAAIRALLERAACVIVPCEATRAWAGRISREARVACVPAAVPLPAATASLAGRPNVVLFLGRLERDKGVFDLLEALAVVRAAVPDVRLVCAGEGDRGAVERRAGQLGVRDAVKFVGWVGPSGKRALLESAAVLALPSYAEALPASVLEAMAAGVPVVATAVGGIPEAIVDGVSGFLVPPGDTAALGRHLRKLLLDRALAARVGAAGRETVRLRYSTERAIPLLEAVYAALGVGQTPGSPSAHDPLVRGSA